MEHILNPDLAYWMILALGLVALFGMMFGEVKIPWLAGAAGLSWTLIFMSSTLHDAETAFGLKLIATGELVFFLFFVMTIIEGGVHYGMMNAILRLIQTDNKRVLMIIVGFMSFFLSAVLDNLTAAIVMGVLVTQLMRDKKNQVIFACLIIAAANAGGVWSGIGNTTSILLWVGGQLSFDHMFTSLFLPSLVYLACIFVGLWGLLDGEVEKPVPDELDEKALEQSKSFHLGHQEQWGILVLVLMCIGTIIALKLAFHAPPLVGAMIAMCIWVSITHWFINKKKGKHFLAERDVRSALRHIDHSTLIIFAVMLPLVSALGHVGILDDLAEVIIKSVSIILPGENGIWGVTVVMGLLSSAVPNTPLVAASQLMFNYPQDHLFWVLLNYTTGVGGTLLPFGTAAGVVLASKFRGQLTVTSYVKILLMPSLAGFLLGLATIFIQESLK